MLDEHVIVYASMSGIEESGEILKDALLETLVPHASKLDIEAAITAALEAGADDLPAVLSSIPQREILFFGTRHLRSLPELTLLLI